MGYFDFVEQMYPSVFILIQENVNRLDFEENILAK